MNVALAEDEEPTDDRATGTTISEHRGPRAEGVGEAAPTSSAPPVAPMKKM